MSGGVWHLYAKEFIFDNKMCSEFDLMICSFDNGNSNGDMGANIEFITTTTPICGKWRKLASKETKPLESRFQVCKIDNSYIDAYERQAIVRWLSRRDSYKKLQFVQDDYEQVWFNAYITSIEFIEVGNQVTGLTINWKADASHGYGEIRRCEYNEGSTSPLEFFDNSDQDGYIYPDVEIEVIKDGTIEIYNFTEGRTFRIDNCKAGERITQNGDILQLSTTLLSHNVLNDFNFNFFRIINTYETRKNVIATSGCNIKFSYYPIRKVGV